MADSEAAPTAPAAPAAKLYPADAPLTQPELAELLRLLQLVDPKQHAEFFESSHCRPLRKCVMTIAQQQKAKQFGGKPKAEYETTLRRRKEAAGRKAQQAELDRLHVNQGKLRLARLQKLSELQQQPGQAQLPRIADGATQGAEDVGVGGGGLGAAAGGQLQAAGGAAGAAAAREWAADDLEQRSAESAAERAADEEADPDNLEGGRLFRPRACYVCKARYVKLHAFYDLLCPACAELNWAKRNQRCELSGRVAIVTGGRVKIGFHTALKLLRWGARVVVTTRFPADAAKRFSEEADAAEWQARLSVLGLDLRDASAIERCARFVEQKFDRLDVLVHNACQTVRRPASYYSPLIEAEERAMAIEQDPYPAVGGAAGAAAGMLRLAREWEAGGDGQRQLRLKREAAAADAGADGEPTGAELSGGGDGGGAGIARSAAQSQAVLLAEDAQGAAEALNLGGAGGGDVAKLIDVNGQQLDLRARNSWIMKLEEVETPEVAEVFAINALAPFVMNAKLLPLMKRTAARKEGSEGASSTDVYIVNVSAMEGKFHRYKSPYHPHTNMAKAALNMMTRTSAADLAKQGVLMCAVDTGWINDENPLERAKSYAEAHDFQTPIDEIDAAARILDPVAVGRNDGARISGVFLKDYHVTEW